MVLQKTRRQVAGRIEKLRYASGSQVDLVGRHRAQDLHAVAGRDDQSFTHNVAVDETAQSRRARRIVEREPFAHLDRSCLVIDSDQDYRHWFSDLMRVKSMPDRTRDNCRAMARPEKCKARARTRERRATLLDVRASLRWNDKLRARSRAAT